MIAYWLFIGAQAATGHCHKNYKTTATTRRTTTTTTAVIPTSAPTVQRSEEIEIQGKTQPKAPSAVPESAHANEIAYEPPPNTYLPGGFRGQNVGIGSWFRAKHANDYTNGNSWCGYPYSDKTPGFAPDIMVMTKGTNAVWPSPNWKPSVAEYCGLEARVYNPDTGVSMLLYITDAFDHKWVKTPGSIDIMVEAFQKLTNYNPLDKNRVIKNVQWEFTGRRNPKYSIGGPGDP